MVIWNHYEVVLAARARPIKHHKMVIEIELIDALYEIILCVARNIFPIWLFSDSIYDEL